jgi:hypothetical protein
MHPLLIILALAAAAGLILLFVKLARAHAARERERLAGLADWSRLNGFTFSPQDPYRLDIRFRGVLDIGRGHARYAYEVLGRSDPVAAFLFQYQYRTWETRTVTYTDSQGRTQTRTEQYEQTHYRRYLIIEIGGSFPSLLIRREGWFDKLAGLMGFGDVNFESEEFSRRYFVKSSDRQFAYAVIHPQMMEWLMTHSFSAQCENGMLLMNLSGARHDADSCHLAWSAAAGFLNRVPPFVWGDYGKTNRIELPESSSPPPPGEI